MNYVFIYFRRYAMCVIIVKPKEVYLLEDILREAWYYNPDGAGFAWSDGEFVHWLKGFDRFEDFYGEYLNHKKKALVIHFRYRSAGDVNPEMTHPFPITRDPKERLKLKGSTSIGVLFHNGTVSNLGKGSRSDTYMIAKILAYSNPFVWKDILQMTTSKYVILRPKQILFVGKFEDKYGCKFSNLSWEYKKHLSESYYYQNFSYIDYYSRRYNNYLDDLNGRDKYGKNK